jgi:NitT/TauT family transport system permease protein
VSRFLAPIVGLVVFFVVWEAFVRVFDIRPFVLAKPSDIVHYLIRFADDYFRASLITFKHAALGFAISVVVALAIGAGMASSTFFEQATQPVLTLIAVTPFAAYIALGQDRARVVLRQAGRLHRRPRLPSGIRLRCGRRHAQR